MRPSLEPYKGTPRLRTFVAGVVLILMAGPFGIASIVYTYVLAALGLALIAASALMPKR